ncbi:tRNA (cytidine(32)/guanosine(34)-2'-O)-methyltransferase [Penicillium chermesinum]|uniref:Putative tRNA (cytidine(32)/guanosine(34)-2'-O)-methyltransferase n=1 Tax=Penicillium chermesinum TaxID=63820 RepID=A0A9W9NTZ5_9EURO|nr:tRNA (cytidine(32)/guanosine(34)-2'-O)-methyltransferase [Penicillium chermesinum]KAJ5226117.1 tRNA (cytidine(32)/guanosine(34)-2'-O)-methyltransferase [Penicillium chermesinum]KAJ6160697.1 tRNA (cytidine(32)/guanosine(34)-2'-O)-methyltransferase [Penicillium chermesinum]
MGKSSKDKRDAYYRLAKEQNWRARSAFKLIQIDEQFDLFEHENPEKVTRVVDLCAAPGSWSQVLSRVLIKGESFGRRAWLEKKQKEQDALQRGASLAPQGETEEQYEIGESDPSAELKPRKNVKIVSIDLQPMAPLEGITTLKADITHPSTIPLLLRALDPEAYDSPSTTTDSPNTPATIRQPHPVDLVISDGAPDVTGLHDLDIYIQSQLLYAALNLAMGVLRPGGKFVAKIFRARDVDILYAQLRTVFERVSVAKPRSSRASSLEAFIVCEGFIPPVDGESSGMAALKNPMFGGAANPKPISEDGNLALQVPEAEEEEEEKSRPVLAKNITSNTTSTQNHITEVRQLHPADKPSPKKLPTKYSAENRWIPPFLACGDLSAWDSDASYALPPDHVSLAPVQPPTAPPYRKALELRKKLGGHYGKTKNVQ